MPLPDNLLEFDPLAPASSRHSSNSSHRQDSSLFRTPGTDGVKVSKYHDQESNIPTNVAPLEAVQTNADPLGCDDLLIALDKSQLSNKNRSSNATANANANANASFAGNILTGSKQPLTQEQHLSNHAEDEILSELNFAAQQSWGTKQQHSSSKNDDLPRSPAVDPTISPSASETYHPSPPSRRSSVEDNIAKSISRHPHHSHHQNTGSNTTTPSTSPSSYFPISRFTTKNTNQSSSLSTSSSRSFAVHTRHQSQSKQQSSPPDTFGRSSSSSIFNNHPHSDSSTTSTTPTSYIGNHLRPYTPPTGAPGFAGEDRDWNKSKFEFDVSKDSLSHHIEFTGVKPGFEPILEENLADAIRPSLPPRVRVSHKWKLLYSLDQDGVSLSTLYSRVAAGMGRKDIGTGCLLVAQDTDGCIFGAYSNEAFKRSESYYGSGECFLWKSSSFGSNDFRVGKSVKAFKWTGRNNYMILSDNDFISFGGGEGSFGLYIDSDLEEGISNSCPTYRNEILCSVAASAALKTDRKNQGKFRVLNVEVWGIGL